ncbi:MAG: aconitate hydratase AcnA [Acidobacteria bacterium]|nr:aconitate hydratase AcnA [Acidobacteriota bacterium]
MNAHAYSRLETQGGAIGIWRLDRAAAPNRIATLPYVVRVFLENVLRASGGHADHSHVESLAAWPRTGPAEFPFMPARVILQDFTGVPVVADLAAIRAAVAAHGGDPARVNPIIPVDLVIDHSVIVDAYGSPGAFGINTALEVERNRERYAFLRWAQRSFRNFSVVPPGSGIVHQVNLERLARVVATGSLDGEPVAYPDTLVGTDSHTTMIGGIGVLGWGVGGIEAEAAMLGEPIGLLTPLVVGVRLSGSPPEGTTATDLVLSLTEMLRHHGVVGRFVEFFGPGLDALTVPDRATVANMAPEYGATEGFFPVDAHTLAYLRGTGRDGDLVDLVERYAKEQLLFREPGAPDPTYSERLDFDLGGVEPSLAGPRRPQDRVALGQVRRTFLDALASFRDGDGAPAIKRIRVATRAGDAELSDGSVIIAAITSCTNTSNPSVMVAAGLLARKAVERGLRVPGTVKTSLAPGSQVVPDYLARAGVLEPLEALGFSVVGYGCTTCIGNSGPLDEPVAKAIDDGSLACAAVLSGNRNFEGRIHPQVRLSYLASPPLVVAYALAGTTDIDLTQDPIGRGADGRPVMLSEIWPTSSEVTAAAEFAMDPDTYRRRYERIADGDERWRAIEVPTGDLYAWDPSSTYIAEPPFLLEVKPEPAEPADILGARVLVRVGDSVTTDHISPAGTIPEASPAARWLQERGVPDGSLHSYGARRGNHEVMVRGTFANIRLRNALAPGTEGGVTDHLPDGERATVFDAAERYRAEGVPLLVIAGKEYGTGSSRDWAAKGTALLGVRAVIARSYERIHRSNLVQMGVLPLEFLPGESAESVGITGFEAFDIVGISGELRPEARVKVVARDGGGRAVSFETTARLDSPSDVDCYRNGGILPAVLRRLTR